MALLRPGAGNWFVWRHGKQWEAWDGQYHGDMPKAANHGGQGQFVTLWGNGAPLYSLAPDLPKPPLDQLRESFAYKALTGKWPT